MTTGTFLALGLAMLSSNGLQMLGTIVASAAWVVGSFISTGNLIFVPDVNTTTTPGIYLGTTKLLALSGSTTAPNSVGFDSTNTQAACIKYGVNFVDCYQEVPFTNTGASFGAGTYYNVASITKPYSGSGGITRVVVNCGAQPIATNVSVDQVSSLTSSGTYFLSRVAIGSGAIKAFSGTGGVLWRMNTPYIKVTASAKVGASHCVLQVRSFGSNRR
jgi:hypothetical protein